MPFWIYDENGWPSGFGDGIVNGLGIEYVDATCPYVSKIHNIVASQPAEAKVFLVGDAQHPEVAGIMSFANGEKRVFHELIDVKMFEFNILYWL